MNMRFTWVLLALCGSAQAGDDLTRAQIAKQRDAIEAKYTQRQQACREQFVVTPCLEKARIDRQEAVQSLRARELAIDDEQRRQRALDQAQRLSDKAKAAAERERLAAMPRPQRTPKPARVDSVPEAARAPQAKASVPDRSADEKRQREQFEARRREIQAHREAVEKRNAERATHKAAVPLPVPASAVAR